MTVYYKVLDEDRASFYGGRGWWFPRKWMPTITNPIPCKRGYHLCRRNGLVHWLGPTIWEAKPGDIIISDRQYGPKVVTEKASLVRKLKMRNERTARLFAADCAEHVLPLFEAVYPDDMRIREAIGVARAFADGVIDVEALDAARDAARAAARAAASGAAAARTVARYAARDAASGVAWSAARTVAKYTARDAARYAALEAARGAEAVTRGSERTWQTERLFDYLEGRLP